MSPTDAATAYGSGPAALRYAIDQELREAAEHHPEAIPAAAFASLDEIEKTMEVNRKTAFELRRSARRFIMDRWMFEDEAGWMGK